MTELNVTDLSLEDKVESLGGLLDEVLANQERIFAQLDRIEEAIINLNPYPNPGYEIYRDE